MREFISTVVFFGAVFSIPAIFVVFGHAVVKPAMEDSDPTSLPGAAGVAALGPQWPKSWCQYCEGEAIWTDDGKARCQTCGAAREVRQSSAWE